MCNARSRSCVRRRGQSPGNDSSQRQSRTRSRTRFHAARGTAGRARRRTGRRCRRIAACRKSIPCASWSMRCAKVPQAVTGGPPQAQCCRLERRSAGRANRTRVSSLAQPMPMAKTRFRYAVKPIDSTLSLTIAFDLQVKRAGEAACSGPFIISSNHQSYLDPFILSSVLPWRDVPQHVLPWAPAKSSAKASCGRWRACCAWWSWIPTPT